MTDLIGLGVTTGAVWTRRAARQFVSADVIRAMLYDGAWQSPLPGVYADGGYALTAQQWGFACVLATGGEGQPLPYGSPDREGKRRTRLRAVACGRTAARVWGFPLIDDDDPATGATDCLRHDVSTWRHLREMRSVKGGPEDAVQTLNRHQLGLGQGDIAQLPSGLWISGRVRTLVDLAALVTHEALVCAIDYALNRGVVTEMALRSLAERRAGFRSARLFLAALDLADEGAESPAETLSRLILLPVLPGLRTQVKVLDHMARLVARLDLGDEHLKLAVESDGKAGHAGEVMVAKDRRRDARTAPFGWWTERVTWFELRSQQEAFRKRVLQVAEKRRRRVV